MFYETFRYILCNSLNKVCSNICARELSFGSRNHSYLLRNHESISIQKRYKGKTAKGSTTANKQIFVDPVFLEFINHQKMLEDLESVVEKFKERIYREIRLRLTPDILMDMEITNKKETQLLSRIAEIIPRTADTITVELGANQDWFSPVAQELKQSGLVIKEQNEGSAIIISQPKITKEKREQLVKKGKDISVKAKKDMDVIYQVYDKKLKPKILPKGVSTDDVRHAKELLRQDVKYFHSKIDEAWRSKEQEVLS